LENILINDILENGEFNVKIADFGLSTFGPQNPRDKLFEKCGTPCYVAPEILKGEGYTTKCDIFSVGSIFFNLLSGRYLFPGQNKEQVLRLNKICDLKLANEFLEKVSEPCRKLILWMLDSNPGSRPSARQALKHEWFK
jgi:serine/threonine protein kinase